MGFEGGINRILLDETDSLAAGSCPCAHQKDYCSVILVSGTGEAPLIDAISGAFCLLSYKYRRVSHTFALHTLLSSKYTFHVIYKNRKNGQANRVSSINAFSGNSIHAKAEVCGDWAVLLLIFHELEHTAHTPLLPGRLTP